MDRMEPNGGQPYKQVYRGGYEVPSVRVRHVIRAAEVREARWMTVADIALSIAEAVVTACLLPWHLVSALRKRSEA